MTNVQSSDAIARLANLVLDRWGLLYPRERHRDLSRGADAAAKALGLPTATFLKMILGDPANRSRDKLLSILVDKLTVGESYFFREPRSMQALDESILPELLREKLLRGDNSLRLWSAGCATGEEPYTLSILLDRLFARLGESPEAWSVEIIATDINRDFLRRAREGVYREWSFRAAPPWLKDQYFEKTEDNRWRVVDTVRDRIRFSTFNLCGNDSAPASGDRMDVILCRNVLIYLAPDKMQQVLRRIRGNLTAEGWFITSPTESSHVLETRIFTPCRALDMLAFCKFERNGAGLDSSTEERSLSGSAPREYAEPQTLAYDDAGQAPLSYDDEEPVAVIPEPAELEPEQLLIEAGVAIAQGDPEQAEAYGREYLERYGGARLESRARAKSIVAQSLASRGRLEEAQEWASAAVEDEPMNPELRYHHALVLQELGRNDEAVANMERALYLNQSLAMAHFSLGLMARSQGDTASAQRHFSRLLGVLGDMGEDAVVPLSEGMSAARLRELVESLLLSR